MTPAKFKKEIERLINSYGGDSVVFKVKSAKQPIERPVTLIEYARGLNPEDKNVCNRATINLLEQILKRKYQPVVKL